MLTIPGVNIISILAVILVVFAVGTAEAKPKTYPHGGSATAYHVCDGSTFITAMGTKPKWGVVANNQFKLGTWVEFPRPITGKRYFRIEDRGGPGFAIDFYAKSCSWMNWWGRRNVRFKLVPNREIRELRLNQKLRPRKPNDPRKGV